VHQRAFVLTLVLASAAPAAAQPAAECPTSECTAAVAVTNPIHKQLWQDAAAIHQIKIAFVEALQRFVRAQAGTFGDEGDELRSSLTTMRERLPSWDQAIQTFQAKASRAAPDAESSIAVATVLLDRHRIDDALRALASAEQVDDNRPDLYAMRALAYGASNRPEEAVRALRRAAALDTRDPTLSYSLVQRLTQLKRQEDSSQARQALQRSLATPRRVAFARVGLLSQAPGTAPIIGAAIRIHRALGPGLLEKAYWGCLCFELYSAGMRIETQKPLPLVYRGVNIECAYRADLIVEGLVIVEVEAVNGLAPIHSRQLLTYLRLANCPLGLLLDFGGETMKAGIERVLNERYTPLEHSTGAGLRPAE
jgi:GxxExxY protein